MNLQKLVGLLLIVFVLFWIISQPTRASGSVNKLLGDLRGAGNSVVTFVTGVL